MKRMTLKRVKNNKQAEKLKGKFLQEDDCQILITSDTDAYDTQGNLLFKFRKGVIPLDLLKSGYDSFKGSIELTEGRGIASGSSHKRVRADGSIANTTVGNKVRSGNVGYMDQNAMIRYCRKTAFARKYFDTFKEGIPFVQHIDSLYKKMCPEQYKRQKAIAVGTNKNYVIGDTSFTTVTVNENFVTAVHKDSGDFQEGFGNLIVYREGHYEGSYFCLPEWGVGVDLHNGDVLFVDVHQWHGNTPYKNTSEDFKRIAFVMYYREYMYQCQSPKDELQRVKNDNLGYMTL